LLLYTIFPCCFRGIYCTNHIDSNDQREQESVHETLPLANLLLRTPSTNTRQSTSIRERRLWHETGEGMAASPSSINVRSRQNRSSNLKMQPGSCNVRACSMHKMWHSPGLYLHPFTVFVNLFLTLLVVLIRVPATFLLLLIGFDKIVVNFSYILCKNKICKVKINKNMEKFFL
jgi:hypothetical protein